MAETETPVVAPVKMPKLKVNHKSLACANAWAIALACFFGFAGIFASIAAFTTIGKDGAWSFNMPIFTGLLGSNVISVLSLTGTGLTLLGTLLALVAGIVGIVTLSRVTDGEALKKSWDCIAKTFFAILFVYIVDLVCLVLYSLITIGISKEYGYKTLQKNIWLNSFLPTFIMAAGVCAMAFIAKSIADGKTANARLASFIGVGLGALSFILCFIATMVTLYGD